MARRGRDRGSSGPVGALGEVFQLVGPQMPIAAQRHHRRQLIQAGLRGLTRHASGSAAARGEDLRAGRPNPP
jgi:hypothetical protein